MAKLIVESDYVLKRYGYQKVSPNHFKHPIGHEVKIDSTAKYPYSIKHKDSDSWDHEFSLDGLLDQLGDMHG